MIGAGASVNQIKDEEPPISCACRGISGYPHGLYSSPPPKDSDFRRQILSLVRVLRHWLLFVYIY